MSDWVLGARLETLCLEAVFCFGVVSGLFFLTPYSFSESILVFLFLLAPQMQSCILVLPLQYPPCPPRPAPVLPSNPCAYTHTHILPHQVDLGHPGITDLPFFKFTILPNQCHAVQHLLFIVTKRVEYWERTKRLNKQHSHSLGISHVKSDLAKRIRGLQPKQLQKPNQIMQGKTLLELLMSLWLAIYLNLSFSSTLHLMSPKPIARKVLSIPYEWALPCARQFIRNLKRTIKFSQVPYCCYGQQLGRPPHETIKSLKW